MDSFPLHLPPIYYIYCREITPVDSTRVHVHCRCTHTNAILKAQWVIPYQITLVSPISHMADMDQIIQRLSCLNQWPVLQILMMNPNPSTHGDIGWVRLGRGVTSRS